MMATLEDTRSKIVDVAGKLSVPEQMLPTFGFSEQTGRPHIEVSESGYQYVVCERGSEFERTTYVVFEELLFKVLSDATFWMGVSYELKHRDEALDCRRKIFAEQVALMATVSLEWADRIREQQKKTLQANPYDDMASKRARLTDEYRRQGHKGDEAWSMACEKYPLA